MSTEEIYLDEEELDIPEVMSGEETNEEIDVRGDEIPLSSREARDKLVRENLRISFGLEAEIGWRGYENSLMFSKGEKRENGRGRDTFVPSYVPCPMYVKKAPNAPFEVMKTADGRRYPSKNFRRCNFTIPERWQGTRQGHYMAIAHMREEHFEDWYEVNKRTHDMGDQIGNLSEAPPMSSEVHIIEWKAKGAPSSRDKTDFEINIDKGVTEYNKIKRGKKAANAKKEKDALRQKESDK